MSTPNPFVKTYDKAKSDADFAKHRGVPPERTAAEFQQVFDRFGKDYQAGKLRDFYRRKPALTQQVVDVASSTVDPTHSDPTHSDPTHSDPTHSDPTHSDPTHNRRATSLPSVSLPVTDAADKVVNHRVIPAHMLESRKYEKLTPEELDAATYRVLNSEDGTGQPMTVAKIAKACSISETTVRRRINRHKQRKAAKDAKAEPAQEAVATHTGAGTGKNQAVSRKNSGQKNSQDKQKQKRSTKKRH